MSSSDGEDFSGFPFEADLEDELDEMAELCINADPRLIEDVDKGVAFDKIAERMVPLDEKGYVRKMILKEGVGPTPSPYARMLVHYDFFCEGCDEPFDSTFLRSKPAKLRLDENELISGLEIGLKSMKNKETAKFIFHWEVAFGKQGCPPRIPKECKVLAYVKVEGISELISTGEDVKYIDGEARLTRFGRIYKDAKYCHCEGNEEFSFGHYKLAIKNYRKCIAVLNDIPLSDEDEEKRMLGLKTKCLVNLAVCYNKLLRPEQACIVARQALCHEERNVKAMFQYGKSNLMLGNLELAEKWLTKAITIKPSDEDIRRELNTLIKKKEEAAQHDLDFAKRVFADMQKNKETSDKK